MNSPSQNGGGHNPPCMDVSPERLSGMTASELADAMEEALDFMTDETYDPDVVSAYLDALERRVPVPEHPGAEAAYKSFQQKLKEVSSEPNVPGRASRRRNVWRVGLVAALMVSLLFGAMLAAQAFGFNVFGALARWTDEEFSFGEIKDTYFVSSKELSKKTEIPEEYKPVKKELEKRGLPLRFPKIPEGFEVIESLLYIDPATNNVEFTIAYMRGDDFISFDMTQNEGESKKIYEKDSRDVETYEYDGTVHYLFHNNKNIVAAWKTENMEYSISANTSSIDLKQLIRSFYGEVEIPEEYRELKKELEKRGLPLRFPELPEGFELSESSLYIVPADKSVQFVAVYKRGDDCLIYEMIQNVGPPQMLYEKDGGAVDVYEYNDISHYIFSNEGDMIAVWTINDLEYSISSNTDSVDLKRLIRSFYKE